MMVITYTWNDMYHTEQKDILIFFKFQCMLKSSLIMLLLYLDEVNVTFGNKQNVRKLK